MVRKKSVPPQFQKLDPAQFRAMKWKNGGGETLEIAVDTNTPYRWRLSSAKVSGSGPFSLYPGYDRHLVVLEGGTLSLTGGGTTRLVPLREVYSFPGETEFTAHLIEPCRDLNLFVERKTTLGSLHLARYRGSDEIQFPYQGIEHFVYVVDGTIEFLEPNLDLKGQVDAGFGLRVTRPETTQLLNLRTRAAGEKATVAWVTISYK